MLLFDRYNLYLLKFRIPLRTRTFISYASQGISIIDPVTDSYPGKHLLLFTKGWTLTNLIGQFIPAMHARNIMVAKLCSLDVYANDRV